MEWKIEDPREDGFLLFIGSQAFHSSGSPSLCVCFSLVENTEGSLSCDKAVACEMGKRDPSLWGVGLPCQSTPLRAVTCTCSIHASFTKLFCAQITWVWLHVSEILKHSGKSSESLDMHEFWRLFCGLFSSLLRKKLQQTTLKPLDSRVPNDRVTVSLCLWKDNT